MKVHTYPGLRRDIMITVGLIVLLVVFRSIS